MIEYRCPGCRDLAFKADTPIHGGPVRVKCRGCRTVVTPRISGPLYAEYECRRCRVRSVRIAAPDSLSFCVPCGVRMEMVEQPEDARVEMAIS